MDYMEFLKRKELRANKSGMDELPALGGHLFPHQKDTTEFLLTQGKGAAFLDTGMGKTAVELEYARCIVEHTNRPVLLLAPLAVGKQHEREALRFNADASVVRSGDEVTKAKTYITNYERLHLFNPEQFSGLVLDESSCIKNFTGITTRRLMEFGSVMDWKLAATATPAPNDHMELGQHCQFLDVMRSSEMLARWFIADQTEMGRYRLKRHAIKDYWSWVASWARCVGKPSDLGYSDDGFDLPELLISKHIVETDITQDAGDKLFRIPDMGATSIHKEKRLTSLARAEKIAALVEGEKNEAWMIWVETDYDADSIMSLLPDAVEVRGTMSPDMKEDRLNDFTLGNIQILVSKPSIAGFGLNWQHCARTAFVGLSFSYEMFYQAIRRFWRFGQQRPVHCHIAMADTETPIWQTIERKRQDHEAMKVEMFDAMRRAVTTRGVKNPYSPQQQAIIPDWLRSAV